jgi:hypothetical protein
MVAMRRIEELERERMLELLRVYAQNWLAHDGCWFLGIEEEAGQETARRYNNRAWERFSPIEARRVLEFLGRRPGEGLDALAEALGFRLYAAINRQEVVRVAEDRLLFRMNECRVQTTRKRKGLPDYPCKAAGVIEYAAFARTVDPRIETRCVACPPDEHPAEWFCAWEFHLEGT